MFVIPIFFFKLLRRKFFQAMTQWKIKTKHNFYKFRVTLGIPQDSHPDIESQPQIIVRIFISKFLKDSEQGN